MPAEVGLICRPPEVLPPEPALDEAEDDVVVANDLGRGVGEELGEKVFELILVRDNHIAVRAIAAILAHRDDMTGHDADGQHELAPAGRPGAARAATRPVIDMWVEGETVPGRKLAESAGRGFLFRHGVSHVSNNGGARLYLYDPRPDINFGSKRTVHRALVGDLEQAGALFRGQRAVKAHIPLDPVEHAFLRFALRAVGSMYLRMSKRDRNPLEWPAFASRVHRHRHRGA